MADTTAGVRTQHPAYAGTSDKWKRCRDVSGGRDAVHAAGEHYLPRLKDQENSEYAAYVTRATFYNASWRTIAGLNGMLFRKPPKIDAPETVKPLFDDVTLGGVSLHILAQTAAEECLTVGRAGLLVDYPSTGEQVLTAADAALLNLRPTICLYKAESIINWRQRVIANASVLSLVVLVENQIVKDDGFRAVTETRYRVLDLDPAGAYRVRIFRINEKTNEDEQVGGDVYPLMSGKALNYIPFAFIGPDDTTPEVDDPPLIDLVDMNLAHYRVSADYEAGCHFAGLPTPVISGYTKETADEKLYVGSSAAWIFPDPSAKAVYLEFTGQGLKSLETNLEKKEQQMAVLGARMLEALKRGVESAQTASIHRVGEESVLSAISQSVSIGMTKALGWFAQWAGAKGEAAITLNRDFFPTPLTDAMLTALIAGWQSGAYSYATLFANLKAGEVVDVDATPEDEQAAIDAQPPVLTAPLAPVAPLAPDTSKAAPAVNAG